MESTNMNINRENVVKAAQDAVGNLIYTAVFDTCNEIISTGVEQDAVLQCANKVVNNYVEGGIKIRKKPAPRAKTKTDKPMDAVSAASRKLNGLTGNFVWIVHPKDNKYSYTTSTKLTKGYPVRDNATGKIVMSITDDSAYSLTMDDIKIGYSMGLDMDFSSVQ